MNLQTSRFWAPVRGPHGKSTEVGDSRKVEKIVGNRCQRETPVAFQHVR